MNPFVDPLEIYDDFNLEEVFDAFEKLYNKLLKAGLSKKEAAILADYYIYELVVQEIDCVIHRVLYFEHENHDVRLVKFTAFNPDKLLYAVLGRINLLISKYDVYGFQVKEHFSVLKDVLYNDLYTIACTTAQKIAEACLIEFGLNISKEGDQ